MGKEKYPELNDLFDYIDDTDYQGTYKFSIFDGTKEKNGIDSRVITISTQNNESYLFMEELLDMIDLVYFDLDASEVFVTKNRSLGSLRIFILKENDTDKNYRIKISGIKKLNLYTGLKEVFDHVVKFEDIIASSKFLHTLKELFFNDATSVETGITPC